MSKQFIVYLCTIYTLQMTDVEAGGSTVFLDAEAIIEPQKVNLTTKGCTIVSS